VVATGVATTAARAAVAVATISARTARSTGPDGVTVTMLTLAGFLAILALMAWQIRSSPARPPRRMIVVRRVYETHVIETIVGATHGGNSVTQSVSSSAGGTSLPTTPATRSS
jgi:hypothetical protein